MMMLPIETVRRAADPLVPGPGAIVRFDVRCPVHGGWAFPPDEPRVAESFAMEHADCVPVPAELQRRRRYRKSRRSALPAGLAPFLAPSPILLDFGQPVKMEAPPDASWVTLGKPGGSA